MFFFDILFEELNAVISILFRDVVGKTDIDDNQILLIAEKTANFFLVFILCFYNLFSFFSLEKIATKIGLYQVSSIIKIDRVVTDEKDCKRYLQEDDNIAFQNHNRLK